MRSRDHLLVKTILERWQTPALPLCPRLHVLGSGPAISYNALYTQGPRPP